MNGQNKTQIKETQKKDQFIQSLSQQLKPVNVNWSAETRALIWTLFNLAFTFFLMHLIGNFTIMEHLSGWRLAEFMLGLVSIFALGYCAFLGIVPGATSGKILRLGLLPLVAFITLFIVAGVGHFEPTAPGVYRKMCNAEILLLSFVPGIQFGYFLYKDMIFTQKLSFLMAGLVSALIPAFYMNYICSFEILHILKHHFGPTALFGLLFLMLFLRLRTKKF